MEREKREQEFPAHLTTRNGERVPQSLKDHCVQVAEYAGQSLERCGFYFLAYLAGLLHDAGKGTRLFAAYLEASFRKEKTVPGSVIHSFTGVIYLLERYHRPESSPIEKLTSEIIAYAIGAHHGLFDCVGLDGKNGFRHRLMKDRGQLCYEEAMENYRAQVRGEEQIDFYFQKACQETQEFLQKTKKFWKTKAELSVQLSFLSRLVLSAVIYGDRRDTREFMSQIVPDKTKEPDWKRQRMYLEEKLKKFPRESALNRVRGDISRQCGAFAGRPGGIYRLHVPTGGGKTLAALRFCLAHAEHLKKKRIIFIIPLLSVLDQNAKVIRKFLADEEIVQEHHSNVVREKARQEELDLYETLTEDWESPVMISTLVQLLNILFSHRNSDIARMRALCDSVIVIDEIQSLPRKTTAMFNMAMNFLSIYANATIVLSSATQPCFEKMDWPIRFAGQPDMVFLRKEQSAVFRRAEIINRMTKYGMSIEECAAFCHGLLQENDSVLVVCNTRSEARQLCRRVTSRARKTGAKVFHLSTNMCQQHRMDVLADLMRELEEQYRTPKEDRRKLICISTQLSEAGIDFSFEAVVRILAGIDNLIQTVGRCNRGNEYGHGRVYLINLKKERLGQLTEIKKAQDSTRNVLWQDDVSIRENLIGEAAIRKFYESLFQDSKEEVRYPVKDQGSVLYLADLLANKNPYVKKEDREQFVFRQPFKSIGRNFKVFSEDTVDILVPYEEGIKIIDEMRHLSKQDLTAARKTMERAKRYTVSVYRDSAKKLWEAGRLEPLCDGRAYALDTCHKIYGLTEDEERPAEDSMIEGGGDEIPKYSGV